MKREAVIRAHAAPYLDATSLSNGPARKGRERFRKPIRLPPETWEKVQALKERLSSTFPERYITLNSTLEFLVNEGLEQTTIPV